MVYGHNRDCRSTAIYKGILYDDWTGTANCDFDFVSLDGLFLLLCLVFGVLYIDLRNQVYTLSNFAYLRKYSFTFLLMVSRKMVIGGYMKCIFSYSL